MLRILAKCFVVGHQWCLLIAAASGSYVTRRVLHNLCLVDIIKMGQEQILSDMQYVMAYILWAQYSTIHTVVLTYTVCKLFRKMYLFNFCSLVDEFTGDHFWFSCKHTRAFLFFIFIILCSSTFFSLSAGTWNGTFSLVFLDIILHLPQLLTFVVFFLLILGICCV